MASYRKEPTPMFDKLIEPVDKILVSGVNDVPLNVKEKSPVPLMRVLFLKVV